MKPLEQLITDCIIIEAENKKQEKLEELQIRIQHDKPTIPAPPHYESDVCFYV